MEKSTCEMEKDAFDKIMVYMKWRRYLKGLKGKIFFGIEGEFMRKL